MMKENKTVYIPPEIEIIEIIVEKGFAGSHGNGWGGGHGGGKGHKEFEDEEDEWD